MTVSLLNANALWIPLADGSVHCVVTSPPYWSLRDYGISDQLGLEPTPEQYVENMVAVFREVRRVMRPDALLFLNMGDSYLPDGNLADIPHRLAGALVADGWIRRSTVVWSKPNPMPESVNGWRWERCRVKVGSLGTNRSGQRIAEGMYPETLSGGTDIVSWSPCPGCAKCEPNDGLVLRRGSWRPTTAHEYLFIMAKTSGYFADGEGVREAAIHAGRVISYDGTQKNTNHENPRYPGAKPRDITVASGRNLRTVWEIATQPYSGAHFATYPERLVEPCIKAGTSEAGVCAECGAPWARVVEKPKPPKSAFNKARESDDEFHKMSPLHRSGKASGQKMQNWLDANPTQTLGFRRTCDHDAPAVPATILDPFAGSGTTLLVARKLGRNSIGLDLSFPYLRDQARERLGLNKLSNWESGKIQASEEKDFSDFPLFRGEE